MLNRSEIVEGVSDPRRRECPCCLYVSQDPLAADRAGLHGLGMQKMVQMNGWGENKVLGQPASTEAEARG